MVTSMTEREVLRWWQKVMPTDGCWHWLGKLEKTGYGKMAVSGHRNVSEYAHRLAYEMFKGPIGKGMWIDHLCRNRSCVNPSHLEAVTPGVNIMRGDNPHRWELRGECVNGHPYSEDNMYVLRDGERGCLECRRARQRRWVDKRNTEPHNTSALRGRRHE